MKQFSNIWEPIKLVVIFLHFDGKEAEFSAQKIRTRKLSEGTLDVRQRFDDLNELILHYGKDIAYHIHVSGTGILTRKLNSVPNIEEELIISGNPNDFHFTRYDDQQTTVASFFRKELIEECLLEIVERKVHLLGLTSGLVPLLILNEELSIDFSWIIRKKNDEILRFERNDQPQVRSEFNENHYSEYELLVQAIHYSLRNVDERFSVSENEAYAKARVNFRQFKQFKVLGIGLLIGILLSLIVNYLYQNSLNTSVAQLELDLSLSNDNLALMDRLEQELDRKEQLVLSAGVNSSRFLSLYLDEIGASVPKQINLIEMNLFPIIGKLKDKRKVEIDQNSIVITGSTIGNETLDDWMEQMDRFEWVAAIELINYQKDENDRADFTLTISLNN
ncbi:MAG: hypothetical protein QNK23_16830 [Crocinitomicaceae bacterium]|nr:hypothetical protein [Crocinitomicaceae bacterium]